MGVDIGRSVREPIIINQLLQSVDNENGEFQWKQTFCGVEKGVHKQQSETGAVLSRNMWQGKYQAVDPLCLKLKIVKL